MSDNSVLEALGQVEPSAAGDVFRDWLRGEMRTLIADILAEEVTELCGPAYKPAGDRGCRRAGGTRVGLRIDGIDEEIRKPRVRRHEADTSKEVRLKSYDAVNRADDLRDRILRATAAGVSSRDQKTLYPDSAPGRSRVSRAWIVEGRQRIQKLRDRDLKSERFFCMLLDGIVLSEDLSAIVGLGITLDGRKVMLDFEIGAQESTEVCDALLDRLVHRGLEFEGDPLAVLDGSRALHNSVLKHFPRARIQRCLVHKERNIKRCLSRRHHGSVSDLFKRLRSVEGEEAGREALADLERFLSRHSHKALESLHEAGEELITVHKLNAPSTLHTTLTNTNCIENPFRNTRAKIGRVKRWRAETDQAERWLAYSLLRAEKGFRRIKGYRQIPVLLKSLGWPSEAVEASLRSALGPPGHPASGGNGLHSTTPHPQAESEANCRTGTGQVNDKELHRNEDRDRQRVSTGFGTSPQAGPPHGSQQQEAQLWYRAMGIRT
ncbi:IS256 family transposase [Kiritimatiella glycovorans]|uniref:Transposase n=1 Tax=Kiritimatiella glycovorans TaxID=1307763 RepID=A0A0G3EH54_9BACT|nr:transposase [Kiritimatiella glycovorans]AKJ65688.1 Transposase [Kiritimatiella glycovorans]